MSEVRLIDANALKQDLRQYFTDGVLDGVSAKLAFNQILLDIDNAPTVEQKYYERIIVQINPVIEERPQGEWLDEKFVAFHLTCNKCGCNIRRQKEEVFEGNYDYNFCPNCGADMRGGKDEID